MLKGVIRVNSCFVSLVVNKVLIKVLSLFCNSENQERLDLALREMNKKLGEELEGLEVLLAAAHAKEVQKLQDTIQDQV